MDIRKTKLYKQMTTYDACAIAEGFDGMEHSKQELQTAWQYLVDTGTCWKLQGWYGRQATNLIENGIILPPNKEHKNYYGNVVPAVKN